MIHNIITRIIAVDKPSNIAKFDIRDAREPNPEDNSTRSELDPRCDARKHFRKFSTLANGLEGGVSDILLVLAFTVLRIR